MVVETVPTKTISPLFSGILSPLLNHPVQLVWRHSCEAMDTRKKCLFNISAGARRDGGNMPTTGLISQWEALTTGRRDRPDSYSWKRFQLLFTLSIVFSDQRRNRCAFYK